MRELSAELQTLWAIECTSLEVAHADLGNVDERLNAMGRERWECYHVSARRNDEQPATGVSDDSARRAGHLSPPVVADEWRGHAAATYQPASPGDEVPPPKTRLKLPAKMAAPALGVEGNLIERRALGVEHGVLPTSWEERGV